MEMHKKRTKLKSLVAAGAMIASGTVAHAYSNGEVLDGFNKTVFGSEFANSLFSSAYVRKFTGTVRVYVNSEVGEQRRRKVERFVLSLNSLVAGLNVKVVKREADANFVVNVVRRRNYAATIRNEVFKNESAPIRGRCMVRSVFTRSGISRSDAVIVADEGENLFNRCMTEEILQGLGPLNDDPSLKASMFNDSTPYTTFRRFDRLLLNMLYDERIRPGASRSSVQAILPRVLSRVRRQVNGH